MNLGLFVLRLVVGLLFVGHGAQKLFGAFGGGGIEGTAASFEQGGLRPGRLHAWAAGLAEAGGGALLVLGLLTPFAAAALIGVMTAAIATVHAPRGVWVGNGGYEYNLVLVAAAVALAGAGPGAWAIDHAFGWDLAGTGWAIVVFFGGVLGGGLAVLGGRAQTRMEESRRAARPPRGGAPATETAHSLSDHEEEELAVEEAEAAASEAGEIGGPAPLDEEDPAKRPLVEGGGGEAEGFELAEERLEDVASHGDQHRFPDRDVPGSEEPGGEYGEADEEIPPDQ
jgi:putative oxidoreductase